MKIAAKFISFILHPLLVSVYMAYYVIYVNPYYFQYSSPLNKLFQLVTVANNNFVFPVLVVLLLKGLGFNESIYLRTQKERIVPYMACIIFFFWTWYVFYNNVEIPQVLKDAMQGVFFAAIAGSIANIYFKISMHAMGMGGLLGMMVVVLFDGHLYHLWPLVASVLLTGIVISARIVASDHKNGDLLVGFITGFIAQMVAAYLV
jgi:hypothetical protein